jgi:hypothetical protein
VEDKDTEGIKKKFSNSLVVPMVDILPYIYIRKNIFKPKCRKNKIKRGGALVVNLLILRQSTCCILWKFTYFYYWVPFYE